MAEKAKELSDYQAETIRVIRGESRLSGDLLSELVDKAKGEITELSAAVEAARQELNECMSSAQQEQQEFEKLQS